MRHRPLPILLLAAWLAPALAGAEGLYLGSGIGLSIPTPEIKPLGKPVGQELGFTLDALDLGYDNKNWGLGIQWGGAGGSVNSEFFGDGAWNVDYLTLSLRYLFNPDDDVNAYLEIGSGAYVYMMTNDLADIESDPVPGLRLAAGVKFNLGPLYVATELDYHAADFSDAAINTSYYHSDLDLNSRVDLLQFMVKTGLQAHK